MKTPRILKPTALVLALMMLTGSNLQAQACGRSFVDVTVLDSKGKKIPGVIIELVAEVSDEEDAARGRDETAIKISQGNGTAVRVSAQDAEEMVKRGRPMSRTDDICGNPLRLIANTSRVRRSPPQAGLEASATNFGFCTGETYSTPSLLKISAAGYVTEYYLGPHLGGCRRSYEIVLTKKNEGLQSQTPDKSLDRRAGSVLFNFIDRFEVNNALNRSVGHGVSLRYFIRGWLNAISLRRLNLDVAVLSELTYG